MSGGATAFSANRSRCGRRVPRAVVAFMGIGLVDPILPVIAADMDATPTQTEFLFTSYLRSSPASRCSSPSFVSSRLGPKRTLMIGLAVIVVFSSLQRSRAASSRDRVPRGWGLGNALFISTALATIVGAASGGTASAIVLYEAVPRPRDRSRTAPGRAPRLGQLAWPFFGVAVLMAAGVHPGDDAAAEGRPECPGAIEAERTHPRAVRTGRCSDSPRLRCSTTSVSSWLLAYTPFPLGFDALGIGGSAFCRPGEWHSPSPRCGRATAHRPAAAYHGARRGDAVAGGRPRGRRVGDRDPCWAGRLVSWSGACCSAS